MANDPAARLEVALQLASIRLRTALNLCATGIELKRAQFRRRHPEWSEAEVARHMRLWMAKVAFEDVEQAGLAVRVGYENP